MLNLATIKKKKKKKGEREIMPLCTFSPPQPFHNPDGKKGSCCCFQSLSHIQLFWDTMDCSPPGSAVHGISQARELKEIAISFSRASFQLRDRSHISCIGRWILYHWATWCCCSVTELCMTLCNPMDWSTLGLPVSHYLLEFAQVHVHSIGDVT